VTRLSGEEGVAICRQELVEKKNARRRVAGRTKNDMCQGELQRRRGDGGETRGTRGTGKKQWKSLEKRDQDCGRKTIGVDQEVVRKR